MVTNFNINNKLIGKRIREERKNLGLSREELAEIIGISDYYIGQLERGERQMSLPVLIKLSNCLHISLDYLIFGKEFCHEDYLHESRTNYKDYKNTLDDELLSLINKCSSQEKELFKKLIKVILPYTGNSQL